MPLVVLESKPLVELLAANIAVVGFQVNGVDSNLAADPDSKLDGSLPDSLRATFWPDVELINQAIAPMKFQRETKAWNHVPDLQTCGFENDEASEKLICCQLGQQTPQERSVIRQIFEFVEVADERQQRVDVCVSSRTETYVHGELN